MSDSRRGSGRADAAGSRGNSSNSRRYGSNLPRSRSHNRASGQPALFESLLEFDIEAERAVLIAQGDNGHVAIHVRSEEHTSELQSQSNLVCRLLLEKKKKKNTTTY